MHGDPGTDDWGRCLPDEIRDFAQQDAHHGAGFTTLGRVDIDRKREERVIPMAGTGDFR